MSHPPRAPRSRRPVVRAAAAATLLVGCALGTAGADVVVLKDGFVIQGTVRKETEKIVDKASGQSFTIPAARGFDLVDEGPKFVIFSSNAKQLGEINKDVKIRPDFRAYTTKFERRKSDQVPFGEFQAQGDWDAKWKRKLKVNVPGGGFEWVEQQITFLDPYTCYVVSPTHAWRLAFRTVEIGPDKICELLSNHPDLAEQPGKPDAGKRLTIARFLRDAGWLQPAKQYVEEMKKQFPGGLPKEATEQADALLKEIDQSLAEAVVQEADVAIGAGRYDAAGQLLGAFPDKTAGPKDVVKAAALRAQQKAALERHATARRLLRAVVDRTTGVDGLGPRAAVGGGAGAAAVSLRGQPNRQLAGLLAAAEQVYAEIHPDSAGRLEEFVQDAEQDQRERGRGQEPTKKPEALLAVAVSGWVSGKGAGTPDYMSALRLWTARELVLEYQRTDDLNTHNRLLRACRQDLLMSPEELAQVITLLPPCEPEDLNARVGVVVPPNPKIPVPPGVFRRGTVPTTAQPKGVEYLIRLPAEYHHGRAYPLIVALTDGTAEPEFITSALAYEADRHGYILATPDWRKAGPEWKWRGEDHTYATEVLRDVVRHFSVDNDRVFLVGGGTGANMALDVGLSHPDLFAGVLAMVPTPNALVNLHYWKNGPKLPVYVVTGEQAGGSMPVLRRLFENWMPRGYPAIMSVYKGRGAEWFGSEVPVMFDWMARKRRPGPTAVLQLDPAVGRVEWQAFRPADNRFYWLGVNNILDRCQFDPKHPNTRVPAMVSGDIKGNQIVIPKTSGAHRVCVWLTRDMINWAQPLGVTIRGNQPITVIMDGSGTTKWKPQVIQPSLEVLLNDYAERGDRRLLYMQKLEFPVAP
jgi:pimeloyl-ACP methyl ester carboxylesterase